MVNSLSLNEPLSPHIQWTQDKYMLCTDYWALIRALSMQDYESYPSVSLHIISPAQTASFLLITEMTDKDASPHHHTINSAHHST